MAKKSTKRGLISDVDSNDVIEAGRLIVKIIKDFMKKPKKD